MRFVNTSTLSIESVSDSQVSGSKFSYAILSHVWGPDEVLFHEVGADQKHIRDKAGWGKITSFCTIARKHGFKYAWIDTCCIDRRSSAELSEAINSMYQYYHDAKVCFIYLKDVHKAGSRDQVLAAVRSTRWLTRGWTLLELLAPAQRRFFTADWSEIEGGQDLLNVLAGSTGISRSLLENRDLLPTFCVAERMRWASKRLTTRGEDIAYSLMGLFNVNMPVLYGEGKKNAFRRLQREIMEATFDMTIFAWRAGYENSGLLAQSPADFADSPPLRLWAPLNVSPYSMTNVGLSIRLNIVQAEPSALNNSQRPARGKARYLAALQCNVQKTTGEWHTPMVYLEPVGTGFVIDGKSCKAYRRVQGSEWVTMPHEQVHAISSEHAFILQDEQYEQVHRATEERLSRNT
ncbi:HET-domain-containing protein [Hypoxylon sp. NC1633]|nr:HET-domain-containing protein [Hypoxylon sp. NC1633]